MQEVIILQHSAVTATAGLLACLSSALTRLAYHSSIAMLEFAAGCRSLLKQFTLKKYGGGLELRNRWTRLLHLVALSAEDLLYAHAIGP